MVFCTFVWKNFFSYRITDTTTLISIKMITKEFLVECLDILDLKYTELDNGR